MKLKQVEIEGYRSIKDRMILHVDPKVTIVLGPNDHGKSNLLLALLHLNDDRPFQENEDLNWDSGPSQARLPSVLGEFTLTSTEIDWLLKSENDARHQLNEKILRRRQTPQDDESQDDEPEQVTTPSPPPAAQQPRTRRQPTPQPVEPEPDPETDAEDDDELPQEPLPELSFQQVPLAIRLSRTGIGGSLEISGFEGFQPEVLDEFKQFLPRFERIDPITKLSDSVSANELAPGKNDFMRGIFYYAGLDPDASQDLFRQTDRTQMTLTKANQTLNDTLKRSWSQGQNLDFKLNHDSKQERIDLLIQDPSVTSTYVRASRRSSGFTHYFSLKTILYSRQQDHPAGSYILLFDEPGVFLHPSGQFDLLQVIEALSTESQVVYVTHSLFMINKTFPSRHRLLMKNKAGTVLNGKPYVGRWQSVLSALGFSLTGSILFANHVLLTEGDSDPIYIYAIIQKAVAAGKAKLDINSLAIMSTMESRHAEVLLRLLCEANPRPKLAIITDGDKGGRDRLQFLKAYMKEKGVLEKELVKGTSIEDHVPFVRELYVPAVMAYIANLMELQGKAMPDRDQFAKVGLEHFNRAFPEGKVTDGVATWAERAAKELGEIEGAPSKVGIAREYDRRLAEFSDATFKLEPRPKALIEWIEKSLEIPRLLEVDKNIFEEQ